MVFHESTDAGVVVMLTQTFESGREKCAQYFPLDADESLPLYANESDPYVNDEGHQKPSADDILGTVKLLECSFDENSRSEVRKLELSLGSQSKTVWHFLFAGWADFAKPVGEDREALLGLLKASGSKCTPNNPRVVHCSAGVGRTGTFIALDHLLRELESGKLLTVTDAQSDPVFETVNQMREQRMMMVYNDMQLQFVYEVLREQVNKKLGKTMDEDPGDSSNGGSQRSTKMAKLSNEDDCPSSSNPDPEHDTDGASTPMRSWSGTPEVSDNE
jgi:protein-tyrosine phosphatase